MIPDTLFDEAGQARDEALARVEAHAAPDWMTACRAVVLRVAAGHEFTTDHVWAWLLVNEAKTHEPRAMGAVLRQLAREGVIVKTGVYRPSKRRECHARPIPVWRRV